MSPEQERLAEALAVLKIHDRNAARHVAERIGALAIEGDLAGIERWNEISARLQPLLAGPQRLQ